MNLPLPSLSCVPRLLVEPLVRAALVETSAFAGSLGEAPAVRRVA